MTSTQAWATTVATNFGTISLLVAALACSAAIGLWAWVRAGAASEDRRLRRQRVFLLLSSLQLMLVITIATQVGQDGALTRLDKALAAALATHASPDLLQLLAWITRAGDRDKLTWIGAAVCLILLLRRRWWLAVEWTVATVGAGLWILFLKNLFARVRPEHVHGFETAHGWSFPSGHSSGAFSIYGMLCYIVIRSTPVPWRPAVLGVTVALVLYVGISRIGLQVHFLSDVLAGFATASLWLAFSVAVSAWLRGRVEARRGLL